MKNRAFCGTSMKFGTQLLRPVKTCFKTGPNQIWYVGVVAAIFKMADMNFQCPYIGE